MASESPQHVGKLVSIRAPTRGAIVQHRGERLRQGVSIRAPTRGAIVYNTSAYRKIITFQSAPPREGRSPFTATGTG